MDITPTTAAEAVIAIPELWELIILQLPAREIITRTTAVSRGWRTAVLSSTQIRHKLHLQSKTPKVINPMSREKASHQPELGYVQKPDYAERISPNPIMEGAHIIDGQCTRAFHVYVVESTICWEYPETVLDHSMCVYGFCRPVVEQPISYGSCSTAVPHNALWRDTLISDPPCSLIYAIRRPAIEDGNLLETDIRTILNERGITWGSFVDGLSKFWDLDGSRADDERMHFICGFNGAQSDDRFCQRGQEECSRQG